MKLPFDARGPFDAVRQGVARVGVLLAVVFAAACDAGPRGPGTVVGTVQGPPDLGGVVLEVEWRGVQDFQGRGATQAYGAAVPVGNGRHRVVLVDPAGGELGFSIAMEDAFLEGPVVTVVEATDTANQSISVSGVDVLLER